MNASDLYSKSSLRVHGSANPKPQIIVTIYLVSIFTAFVQQICSLFSLSIWNSSTDMPCIGLKWINYPFDDFRSQVKRSCRGTRAVSGMDDFQRNRSIGKNPKLFECMRTGKAVDDSRLLYAGTAYRRS